MENWTAHLATDHSCFSGRTRNSMGCKGGSKPVSGGAVMAKSTQALPLDSLLWVLWYWALLALPTDPVQHSEEGRAPLPLPDRPQQCSA